MSHLFRTMVSDHPSGVAFNCKPIPPTIGGACSLLGGAAFAAVAHNVFLTLSAYTSSIEKRCSFASATRYLPCSSLHSTWRWCSYSPGRLSADREGRSEERRVG